MPAPIENPVNFNTPATDKSGAVTDAGVQGQMTQTPGDVGEAIAAQMAKTAQQLDNLSNVNLQTTAALAQSNQQTAEMFSKINETLGTIANPAPAQPAAVDPLTDPRFQLNMKEQEELGDLMPGAIDKLIDRRLMQRQDEFISAASGASTPQITQLSSALEVAQAKIAQLEQRDQQTYTTQLATQANIHGLDLQTLGTQPEWQEFLSGTADPVAGTTYGQYVKTAGDNQDAAALGRIMGIYAKNQQKANEGNIPQNGGMPAAGGARMGSGPQAQPTDIQRQLDDLNKEALDLREKRFRTKISATEFATGAQNIRERMAKLQAQTQPQQ